MKIAIAGGPNTGKTTMAERMGMEMRSTDNLIDLGWSEASEVASRWFDEPGPLVIEGVAVPRALRKWLKRNPTGRPCDRLVVLTEPHVELSKGQAAMASGVNTVLYEIFDDLAARGVEIV